MTLPTSTEEKYAQFDKERRLEQWLYVHELKALLDKLQPDDWLERSEVGNLCVMRDGERIGVIDLFHTRLEIYEEAT